MKLAGPALALLFVSFFVTSFVLADISGNGDVSAHTFAVSCADFNGQQTAITPGGYALIGTTTPDTSCVYTLPATTNLFRFVSIYKGTVGSATAVSGSLPFSPGDLIFGNDTVLTTTVNYFGTAETGDDYFAVAFDVDDLQAITDTKQYLANSALGIPPEENSNIFNYNVVTFKWGAGPADSTGPVITITPPFQTLEATSSIGSVAEFTVSALDETSGDRPVSCDKVTGSMFSLGTSTITCTSTDIAGNATASTSEVVVRDTTAPIITLIGSSTVALIVGDTFVDEGATTSDAVDSSVPVVVGGDTVDMATAGTYVVTYNATDDSGNQGAEVTRSVVVTAPVVVPPTPEPTPTPVSSGGGGGGGGGGGILTGPLSIGYQAPTPVISPTIALAVAEFITPTTPTATPAVTNTVTVPRPQPVVAGVQTEVVIPTQPVESVSATASQPTPVTPQTQTAAVANVTPDYSLPLWAWALLPILTALTALFFILRRPIAA